MLVGFLLEAKSKRELEVLEIYWQECLFNMEPGKVRRAIRGVVLTTMQDRKMEED